METCSRHLSISSIFLVFRPSYICVLFFSVSDADVTFLFPPVLSRFSSLQPAIARSSTECDLEIFGGVLNRVLPLGGFRPAFWFSVELSSSSEDRSMTSAFWVSSPRGMFCCCGRKLTVRWNPLPHSASGPILGNLTPRTVNLSFPVSSIFPFYSCRQDPFSRQAVINLTSYPALPPTSKSFPYPCGRYQSICIIWSAGAILVHPYPPADRR